MNCIEQRIAQRFTFVRQTGDDDVGSQIICAFKQRALPVASQIGQQQNACAVEISLEHKRIVIRAREIIRRVRIQHPPATRRVAAIDNLVMRRRFFEFRDDFMIDVRAKSNRAGVDFANAEKFIERFRAADVARVAMGQDETLDFVDALRAQKWFEREIHGIFVATIHEPVIFPSGCIHKDAIPAFWPDGYTLSSIIHIAPDCPDGHRIECMASYETKSYNPIERKVTWGKVRITVHKN